MNTLFCPNCGAGNRASAKYCCKCASLLAPLSPQTLVMEYVPTARRRRKHRRHNAPLQLAPVKRSAWPIALIVLIALGAGLAGAWLSQQYAQTRLTQGKPPAAAAPASNQAPPAAPAAQTAAAPAALAARPEPEPEPEPEPAAENPPPDTSAPKPSEPAGPPAQSPAGQNVPASAATAHTAPKAVGATPRHAQRQPAGSEAPASRHTGIQERISYETAPRPAAPAPATTASPEQACAGRQFISRAICLKQECSRPGMQRHPTCASIRQRERELQQASGGA